MQSFLCPETICSALLCSVGLLCPEERSYPLLQYLLSWEDSTSARQAISVCSFLPGLAQPTRLALGPRPLMNKQTASSRFIQPISCLFRREQGKSHPCLLPGERGCQASALKSQGKPVLTTLLVKAPLAPLSFLSLA